MKQPDDKLKGALLSSRSLKPVILTKASGHLFKQRCYFLAALIIDAAIRLGLIYFLTVK